MAAVSALAACLLSFAAAVEVPAAASDDDWSSMAGALRGTSWDVHSMVADPAGNLYVGGKIDSVTGVSGDRFCSGVARWNGREWSALGEGLAGNHVMVMALHNDELYVAGSFYEAGGIRAENFAKWDGTRWSTPGTGPAGTISAMVSYQGNLYVAGSFATAAGVTVNNLARWDGVRWSAVGAGANARISVLTIHNGELYAGGSFSTIGGVTAKSIAKWNGSTWSALGTGTNASVTSIAGIGGDLYVAGDFGNAGGVPATGIAKWNGSRWSALGPPALHSGDIQSLAVFGGELYVGGLSLTFDLATGFRYFNMLKWSGSQWFALEANLGQGTDGRVRALAVAGDSLYAGGTFNEAAGVPVSNIARWNGSQWLPITDTESVPTDGGVETLLSWKGELYAGGGFTTIGGTTANRIAKWNGSRWLTLGGPSGGGEIHAMASMPGGISAGGSLGVPFNNIAKWNGTVWQTLGSGIGGGTVRAMAVHEGDLFVGGYFTSAGGKHTPRIARLGAALPAQDSGLSITTIRNPQGGTRVTLTFKVLPGYEHAVEASADLGAGAGWQTLPGAPHQTGMVVEDSKAPRRFYRLRRSAKP